MSAAEKIDGLLERARVAGAEARGRRVRHVVVRTVRELEQRMAAALDGESLRGLAELAPGVRAARVRAQGKLGVDERLPINGRETLVIGRRGWLEMVGPGGASRPVHDDEIGEGDLELVVRAMQVVLERHVQASERTSASRRRAVDLSRRLAEAVGFDV